MVENRNVGQKSKGWSKIAYFRQQLIFRSSAINRNFGRKSKRWSKIEPLAEKRNFGQKLIF